MSERELSILVRAKGALAAARDIGKVDTSIGKLSRSASSGLKTTAHNLGLLGVGVAVGLGAGVNAGIDSLTQLEDATTSVEGAIKSAGQTGQETGAQVAQWANEIEASIGAAFDDKDITAATATLIRFGKVTPSNLRPAMQVMTDLATKTGSVDSAATLLAKALADPTKAAGKLSRAGVVLTKAQQDQIKALVKSGKTAAAQKVILDALTTTTQGAAAASQGPYKKSQSELKDVTEDATRALAEGFLPVIEDVRDILKGELAKPSTLKNIRDFGKGLAQGLDHLINIARNLPWSSIGDALKIAGQGAKAVLDAFVGLPPWIQTAVLTGWGLNKLSGGFLGDVASTLASGLIKGVLGMNAGVVNINAGVVNGGGGLPGVPGGGGGMGAIGKLASLSIVATAAYLSAESIQGFADKNQGMADRGLTPAEITAQKFYNSSPSDQQQAFKHLGYLPTKADYDSGTKKLSGDIEALRGVMNTQGDRSTDGIEKQRVAVTSAGALSAAAARAAGITTAAAIRDKDLSVTIKNSLVSSVVVNSRQVGSGIVKNTIRSTGGDKWNNQ